MGVKCKNISDDPKWIILQYEDEMIHMFPKDEFPVSKKKMQEVIDNIRNIVRECSQKQE